jgi:hypothetical protein
LLRKYIVDTATGKMTGAMGKTSRRRGGTGALTDSFGAMPTPRIRGFSADLPAVCETMV